MTDPAETPKPDAPSSSSAAVENPSGNQLNEEASVDRTPPLPRAQNAVDLPKKKRSLHRISSRFSFNRQQKEPSTISGEGTEATPQTSETNLAKNKRPSSKASSKQSRRIQQPDQPAPKVSPSNNDAHANQEKKQKPSKLFAFLTCCGSSDVEEPSLPAKKSATTQPTQERQSAPAEKKPGPGVAESSSSDFKGEDQLDEKAVLKTTAERGSSKAEDEGISLPQGGRLDNSIEKPKSDLVAEKSTATTLHQDALAAPEAASQASTEVPTSHASTSKPQADSGVEPTPAENVTPQKDAGKGLHRHTPGNSVDEGTTTTTETQVPEKKTVPPPPPPQDHASQTSDSEVTTGPPGLPEDKQYLLPPLQPHFKDRKCLVLDLDETLVHSSFKVLERADFTIPVEIEGQYHNIYVIKRPGVDQFMKRVGELYEIVVFTASVSKYGDPLLDQLDIHHVVHHRLFRDSCYNHQGNYVKDLSQVGRDLKDTIIIDNSPTSYIFHPQHAIPISSWFSDAHDNELLDLIPVLEDLAGTQVRDVRLVLDVAL